MLDFLAMKLKRRASDPTARARTELEAAKQRFTAESLDNALKIAWDLLVAADHPASAPERAKHTRRLIAEAIVRAAGKATDVNALWLAGVEAFRSRPLPHFEVMSGLGLDQRDLAV